MKQINVFTVVIKILSEVNSAVNAGAPPNSILKNFDILHVYHGKINAVQNWWNRIDKASIL